MKLRNKKTGEIINAVMTGENEIEFQERGSLDRYTYSSLAELCKEWEDYEKPKEDGLDNIITLVDAYSDNDSERYPKEIVEKLKAWKRLKGRGFKFDGWNTALSEIYFKVSDAFFIEDGGIVTISQGTCDDLNLLFGGRE